MGFPDSSVKNPPAMQETWVLIPGLGRSPGGGKGYPLQQSGLENSVDCIVNGVAKRWTHLSDFQKVKVENLSGNQEQNLALF